MVQLLFLRRAGDGVKARVGRFPLPTRRPRIQWVVMHGAVDNHATNRVGLQNTVGIAGAQKVGNRLPLCRSVKSGASGFALKSI